VKKSEDAVVDLEPRPISKPLEFEGFEIRVVQVFPDAEKFHRVAVSHPVLDHLIGPIRFLVLCNVRQRDIVISLAGKDCNCSSGNAREEHADALQRIRPLVA
jgi:hypothetical protein